METNKDKILKSWSEIISHSIVGITQLQIATKKISELIKDSSTKYDESVLEQFETQLTVLDINLTKIIVNFNNLKTTSTAVYDSIKKENAQTNV